MKICDVYCTNMNKKIICKYYGGSQLYGLDTPESDLDIRGVFVYDDPLVLLGFIKESPEVTQNEEVDISLKGINDFLRLLMKGNTEAMECLYAPDSAFVECNEDFTKWVRKEPHKFIDTEKLYKCFKGYIQGERLLANATRTGKLGGKRKEAIDTYGFSPKNFSHLLRLTFCCEFFFKNLIYPVKLLEWDTRIHDLCFSIKTMPYLYNKEQLNSLSYEYEERMDSAYNNKNFVLTPDMGHIKSTIVVLHKDIINNMKNYLSL